MKCGETRVGNLNPNGDAKIGEVHPVLIVQESLLTQAGLPTIALPLMTTISLRLPDDLTQRLEQETRLSRQSRSEVIRSALEHFLYEQQRQRLLAAFAAEAATLDRDEIADLAAEFADAEDQALERAEQSQ